MKNIETIMGLFSPQLFQVGNANEGYTTSDKTTSSQEEIPTESCLSYLGFPARK